MSTNNISRNLISSSVAKLLIIPLVKETLIFSIFITLIVLVISIVYAQYGERIVSRLEDTAGENLMKLAIALEKNQNTEDARRMYELASKARFAGEFNRTYVLYRLGYLYWIEQDYEKAESCLKESVNSEYPQVHAFPLLYETLFKLNKSEEAISYAKQWLGEISSEEQLAQAYYYIGRAYKLVNQEEEAEKYWDKGDKLIPGSLSSFELAFLYKRKGDCKKAKEYAESVLKSRLLPTRESAVKKLIQQCQTQQ